VQHHHAHMASCMADNGLEGEVIGIIWDGTGYGTDGTIWGSEFLVGGYQTFTRAASFLPMKLPGGDLAAKEIWRMAVSLLWMSGVDAADYVPETQTGLILQMLEKSINTPLSTGMGRLFDGVSALLGICHHVTYEGQGAVLLEAAAEPTDRRYPVSVVEENGIPRVDIRPMVRAVCRDLQENLPVGVIAAAFMNTLADAALLVCQTIRNQTGLCRVVLSGGTFQNQYLLALLCRQLKAAGFAVYRHHRVAANDEGLSFGQAAVAEKGCEGHVSCHSDEDC